MKTTLQTTLPKMCWCLLLGAGLLLATGCAVEEGGAYRDGPYAYYDYDYYPDGNVYYYPRGRLYYWYDGGYWRSGRHVPSWYHLREEQREHLRLHTREPWTEHHGFRGQERHEERREDHGHFDEHHRDHD